MLDNSKVKPTEWMDQIDEAVNKNVIEGLAIVAYQMTNAISILQTDLEIKQLTPIEATKKEIELATKDKLFITEILNDLYRNGFQRVGKAETMLKDWSRELKRSAIKKFPASRLKRYFYKIVGKEQW